MIRARIAVDATTTRGRWTERESALLALVARTLRKAFPGIEFDVTLTDDKAPQTQSVVARYATMKGAQEA